MLNNLGENIKKTMILRGQPETIDRLAKPSSYN